MRQFRVAGRPHALKLGDPGYKFCIQSVTNSDITSGKLLDAFGCVSLSLNQGFIS